MTQQNDEFKNPYINKAIGTRVYALKPMPPITAIPFYTKVTKLVTGAVGNMRSLPEVFEALKGLREVGDDEAIIYLASLVSTADNELADKLIMQAIFASDLRVEIDGKLQVLNTESDLNNHFSRYPTDTLLISGWAVWENCKHFLIEEGGANFQDLMEAFASKFQKSGKKTT